MSDDVLMDEIGRFDQDYRATEHENFLPGPEALPDAAAYLLEVVRGELKRTPKSGTPILGIVWRVVGGPAGMLGLTFEQAHFFGRQENIDRLGADLKVMGFDAENWNASTGRRFSTELVKALPKLPGVRVQAKKVTNANPNNEVKPFHNLYLVESVRGPGEGGKVVTQPRVTAPVALPRQPQQRPAAPVRTAGAEDEIPF